MKDGKRTFWDNIRDIDSKLDLIVEGHQVLDKKIDDSKSELEQKIKDTHDLMSVMYNDLDKKIDKVDEKIDTAKQELKEDIKRVDEKIDTTKQELKEDIKSVDNKVDTIKTANMDHEERITTLELGSG